MQKLFSAGSESRCAIWHDTLTLGGTDLPAQVRFTRYAEFTFATLGGTDRN